MTVCIAALYDGGKGCVLVSDQMVTSHYQLSYEFENEEVAKIVQMGESMICYSLIAGNVIFANEVLDKAKSAIKTKGTVSIEGITSAIRDAYQNMRKMHIVRNELESRGLSIDSYYQMHQRLSPNIVKIIDDSLRNWNANLGLIVAGKEGDNCHIYGVQHPGDCSCLDSIGYVAIGTGGPHAIYSLIEAGYKKSMNKDEIEKMVVRAKERSEVAPGVGKQTNKIII